MTSKIETPTKTIQLDPNKCNDILESLLKTYQDKKPTIGEILITYGNLGYALGASIGGYKEKGPGIEELKKIYYSEPGRLDVALMLQGMLVTEWFSDWEEQIKKSQGNGENNEQ